MATYEDIAKSIKKRALKSVYLIAGDEPLFIDQLAELFLSEVIPADEQDFNLSVLYGADVSARDILLDALRFPMMGERVLVLVKEAQQVRDIEQIASHINDLPQSTCLVLCYKKKPDKRKSLYKTLQAEDTVYESTRIYDSKIPDFITKSFSTKGLSIDQRTASLMAEATGNDLEKILGEVDKITLALQGKTQIITPEIIEYYVGVSKEYNNFELLSALVKRDAQRAWRIAFYFAANERSHPIQITLATLFGFFSNLMAVYYLNQPNERTIAEALKLSPYAARDYDQARRVYSAAQVYAIVHHLRMIDAASKGVDANLPTSELYKELVATILSV